MKNILLFIFAAITIGAYGHAGTKSKMKKMNDTTNTVAFTVDFKMNEMAAKDGYRMNQYLVQLSDADAKKYDGKKIRVSGKYTIIKGLDNQEKKYHEKGNLIIEQGRADDITFIATPKILILK